MDAVLDGVRRWTGWLPDWAAALAVLAAALGLALILHALVYRLLIRAVAGRDIYWPTLVAQCRRPLRLAIGIGMLRLGAQVAPLDAAMTWWIAQALLLAIIVLIAWVVRIALQVWMTAYLGRFRLDAEDNLLARKHVTQTRILMRVANVVVVVVAAAALLMTFDAVRQYGVSLLAAGGAAGIVLGLALQPVLKNLIAGIQLAVTQPIRIDDALIVEGEWGNVEEITATYVVIKIWDWRRLIVPLSYFIEQPFQNWTRETASLIGAVKLYVDHRADVAAIRARGLAVVEASALWDRDVYNCAVTDVREQVVEIRLLASARSAARAFDLRCEIREALIAFIQAEMPQALPRSRADVTLDPERGALGEGVRVAGPGRRGTD